MNFEPSLLAEFASIQQKVFELQKKLDEMEKANPNICHAYFFSLATKVFEENPQLQSFSWLQYTPSWNDGDICRFSTTVDYPDINGVSYDSCEGDYYKAVVEFLNQFKESQLEEWFGDGVNITCTRNGLEISDYDDC